jgi:hypothetical protein
VLKVTTSGCTWFLKNLHSSFLTLLYPGCNTQSLCYNTGMFDFQSYRWYHWLTFTAFVISLPWLWSLYLFLALLWFMGHTVDSHSAYSNSYSHRRPRRSTSTYRPTRWRPRPIRSRAIKPYRAPRVRKPKVYKGRLLKSGVRSTYDPVFKRWRNQARHSTWRPPLD